VICIAISQAAFDAITKTGLAFDREGRDEEVRERVRVVSHARPSRLWKSGFKTFSQLRLVPLR
jgi:hypothetical protein